MHSKLLVVSICGEQQYRTGLRTNRLWKMLQQPMMVDSHYNCARGKMSLWMCLNRVQDSYLLCLYKSQGLWVPGRRLPTCYYRPCVSLFCHSTRMRLQCVPASSSVCWNQHIQVNWLFDGQKICMPWFIYFLVTFLLCFLPSGWQMVGRFLSLLERCTYRKQLISQPRNKPC